MKTSNKRSHDHASMQQHEQHFINGIGDGKLIKMDLPDESSHRNIRRGFQRKHEASFGGRHKIDFEYYERSASISDLPEDQKAEKITPNAIPQEKIDSNHHLQDLGENFEVHIMKLITILGFFVVFSLATNMQASRKRRKIKSKLKRTDSLLVRQKKKTDDWGEDGDFVDYQSDMPIRDPSPTYFDLREGNNNLHNRKKTGSENRARRRSTVALKKDDFLPHQHKFVVDGGGLDGLDGFDISNPSSSKTLHESGESDDEEMSSPKASPSRCTLQSSSTLTSVGSDLDGQAEMDVETPTRPTKPTIYVDSFAQLTMPNISKSPVRTEVSDGNAKFDSFRDEIELSKSVSKAASSGETEGANGILHKRKDLTACSDAASSLHSPITFSELKLDSMIGGGGFGQVWRATWRGTPVAVKVLSASSQAYNVQKAILQEFAAEINMLSGMRHPNICLYIGACLEPSNRAIVTELAANGSLWDALRLPLKAPYNANEGVPPMWPLELYGNSGVDRRNVMSPPGGTWQWTLVRKVAEGAARGINYLHCGNPAVLHRDLKSANILLDDSYNPKVCDFGLSRIKAHENSMTGNCGTVQWMAPEILANEPYAEPADVYSYGIILWELLTRQCPFEGMNSIQCAMAVLNHGKRPEVPDWCPALFASLVEQCMDKDPKKRPTVAAILSAFDRMPH